MTRLVKKSRQILAVGPKSLPNTIEFAILIARAGPGTFQTMERQTSENELISAFLTGKRTAHATVAGWIDSVLQLQSWHASIRAVAGDIRQETLLTLTENLRSGKYRGEGLKTYVSTITKYKCLHHYRKATRSIPDEVGETNPGGDTLTELVRAEDLTAIRRALLGTDKKCRKLLILRYFRELSHEQLGRRFEIKKGTSRQWLKRCLDRLRKLFFKEEDDL